MVNHTILNQLIDSKYELRLWSSMNYDVFVSVSYKSLSRLYLGHIRYEDSHVSMFVAGSSITHHISYSDPDYQIKLNDIFKTTTENEVKKHKLNV